MKEMMCRVKSFVIFDSPFRMDNIRELFKRTHKSYSQEFPSWSFNSTRKKIISEFWFRQVLLHFATILSIATLVIVPFNSLHLLTQSIFLAGITSFFILTLTNYGPTYYSDFLPKLETILEEQERLYEEEAALKKCKRTQFSIPTLTIIFFVLSKTSSFPMLPCNDRSAELLNNFFGADKDKLKQNLSRLYKPSCLSPKERAEIQKGITTAKTFFESLNHVQAAEILDQLDLKIQRS
jgi:hypothetical protein